MLNISMRLAEHSMGFAEHFDGICGTFRRDSRNVDVGVGVTSLPVRLHLGVGVTAALAASFFRPSLGIHGTSFW